MKPVIFAFASALAAWAGMAALCFQSASQRYRMGLPAQGHGRRLGLALGGAALLGMSLAASLAVDGASFGSVLWLCQAGILGLLLVGVLPYAMTGVIRLAQAAAALAPLLWLLAWAIGL